MPATSGIHISKNQAEAERLGETFKAQGYTVDIHPNPDVPGHWNVSFDSVPAPLPRYRITIRKATSGVSHRKVEVEGWDAVLAIMKDWLTDPYTMNNYYVTCALVPEVKEFPLRTRE